jgi:hypothetical protein
MGRYYVKNQPVLASCGTKDEPDWIPGTVTDLTFCQYRPYRVTLERESDGKMAWNFPASLIIDDNRRNRRNKGVPYKEDKDQ